MAHLSSELHLVLIAAVVILCMAMPSFKGDQQLPAATNAAAARGSAASGSGFLEKVPTSPNASATLCGTPCFGHMMLMTDCVDDILSNFQGYSSGLMQGVRAIFQMSCGGAGSGTAAAGDGPPAAHGALKGGNNAASGKVGRNVSGGATASAAVPAASGAAGGLRHVGNLVWVGINIILVAAQYGAII